ARTHVSATEGFDIAIQWPTDIENAKLSFGVLIPGQVLDQGSVEVDSGEWTYYFQPIQWMAQTSNFDARELASGQWKLGETMVFQFFLEGSRNGVPIHDAMRIFLRNDTLYNYRELLRSTQP
ncbi:MAG: hypothetical protein VX498_11930, partial [Myxococcota bacterium]|nr:hypothetical protein [Myxococcota bacterium]